MNIIQYIKNQQFDGLTDESKIVEDFNAKYIKVSYECPKDNDVSRRYIFTANKYNSKNVSFLSSDLVLRSEANGLILESTGTEWIALVIPPRTPKSNNINAGTLDKFYQEDKYLIYKLEDGTIINLYYYKKQENQYPSRWVISTARGIEVNTQVFNTVSYQDMFEQSLNNMGLDKEEFYNSLDKNTCYTFGFKHPDMHPFQERKTKPVYKVWFVQSTTIVGAVDNTIDNAVINKNSKHTTDDIVDNKNSEHTIDNSVKDKNSKHTTDDVVDNIVDNVVDNIIDNAIDNIVDEKKNKRIYTGIKINRKTLWKKIPQQIIVKTQFKNVSVIYDFIKTSYNDFIYHKKPINFGYILIAKDISKFNDNYIEYSSVLLESILMNYIRKLCYDLYKRYEKEYISNFTKTMIIHAYLYNVNYDSFRLIFPQFRYEYNKIGNIMKKLVNDILLYATQNKPLSEYNQYHKIIKILTKSVSDKITIATSKNPNQKIQDVIHIIDNFPYFFSLMNEDNTSQSQDNSEHPQDNIKQIPVSDESLTKIMESLSIKA
jgi:hypothetical protein